MPEKKFIFSKVAGSKMSSFTRIFQGFVKSLSNLAQDFWEECFPNTRPVISSR